MRIIQSERISYVATVRLPDDARGREIRDSMDDWCRTNALHQWSCEDSSHSLAWLHLDYAFTDRGLREDFIREFGPL